jgi:hypothetical protein
LFEAATIEASMAIDRPQAIDAAPLGPERSGGCRRRDFLASPGMGAAGVPALAVWQAPGSLAATIAARRSRLAVLWRHHAIERPRESPARQPTPAKDERSKAEQTRNVMG